jgi:hypothetical protein
MNTEIRIIKKWLRLFIAALIVSGFTAIPVEKELSFLCQIFPIGTSVGNWLDKVYMGFHHTNYNYPFLAYGYDWLAFAHFMIAILFIGALKNPVRNKWVIEFGIIACLLIIPYAFIAGHFRGIPVWWRIIDCSFGIAGLVPLLICLKKIKQIEPETTNNY